MKHHSQTTLFTGSKKIVIDQGALAVMKKSGYK